MTDKPPFFHVDWQAIGPTYDKDALLSRLFLENEYLYRLRNKFSVGEGLPLPNETEVHDLPEFVFVRQYRNEVKPSRGEGHLVLANEYPSLENQYANGFVHRRVKLYQEAGLDVDVIAFGKRLRRDVYVYDGVNVLSGYSAELRGIIASGEYKSLSIHFLNSEMWQVIKPHLSKFEKVIVYLHGYEVRNWSRIPYEIRTQENLDNWIERGLRNRDLWPEIVAEGSGVTDFCFVSDWWRSAVADDIRLKFSQEKTHVIHNVIDTELFHFEPKNSDQRFNLLWIRNASAWNYGADIAALILKKLKQSNIWPKLKVTIVGDGKYFNYFDEFKELPNVSVHRGFLSQTEISQLHKTHGLFLIPSRFDTQGVSRDEAMSSGLVPITCNVAAVPEFASDDNAIFGTEDQIDQWVDQIIKVIKSPEIFERMSESAAKSVRAQRGPDNTVKREIELMIGTKNYE